jgi:hypothetical protein
LIVVFDKVTIVQHPHDCVSRKGHKSIKTIQRLIHRYLVYYIDCYHLPYLTICLLRLQPRYCVSTHSLTLSTRPHDSLINTIMDKGEQPSSLSLVVRQDTLLAHPISPSCSAHHATHLPSQQHEACRPPQLSSRRRRR